MHLKFSLTKPISFSTKSQTRDVHSVKSRELTPSKSNKSIKRVLVVEEVPKHHNPFINQNEPLPKRKRTQYAVTPEKLNIVEIRRKMNEKRIKTPDHHAHCDLLYKLNNTRLQIKDMLHTAKMKAEYSEKYNFHPTINSTSRKLMQRTNANIIDRNIYWLQERNEKLEKAKEEKQRKNEEVERMHLYYCKPEKLQENTINLMKVVTEIETSEKKSQQQNAQPQKDNNKFDSDNYMKHKYVDELISNKNDIIIAPNVKEDSNKVKIDYAKLRVR